MADVDALLDLGGDESPPPRNRDSSDLFVVHTTEEEGNYEEEREEDRYSGEEYRNEEYEAEQPTSDTLDEFDPYAETETTEIVETRVDSEGVVHTTVTKTSRVIRSRSHSREVPEIENQTEEKETDESQFDDLLGGLANGTMTTTSGTAAAAVSWEDMEATGNLVDIVTHSPSVSPCTENVPALVHDPNITNTSQSSPSASPELSELMRSVTNAYDDGQMESFPDTVAPRAESEDLTTEDFLLSPSSEHERDTRIGSSTSEACCHDDVQGIPEVATTNGIISPGSTAVDGGGRSLRMEDRYHVDTRSTQQMWDTNVPQQVTGENLCRVCQKRVYEMEKVIADEVIYHKTCFKCNHCKRVLSLGNFASISGQLLCKPHFMELFKTKEDEPASKKTPSPNATSGVDGYSDRSEVFHFNETEDQMDDGIAHETTEKEKIHFTEMSSVRTKFEDISHNAPPVFPSPVSPKRASKWDKSEDSSPPPPINHPQEEEEVEEVVMSPDSTRDLIARFASKEDNREVELSPPTSPRWKPVHRITPPRDLLRETIKDAQINGATNEEDAEEEREEVNPDIVKSSNEYVKAEELPVPEKTRSILAKFRSMEDVNAPPLSPTKSIKKPFAVSSEASHSAPNLGAADSVVTNGNVEADHEPEVVRPDSQEKHLEGEFPEYGLTKNLLARWRTLEQQSEVKAMFPTRSNLQKRKSDPACSFHQMEPVEVPRTSATDDEAENEGREEESLPPPCYTRNILAKFQSMEQQAGRKDTQVHKKEYKWTVKEPKMLLRPGSAKSQSSSSTGGDTDHHIDDGSDMNEHEYNDDEEVLEQQDVEEELETLPPVAHTRNLLQKFRQMEDSSIPPPSPERSTRIQRAAVQQVSARKTTVAPPISNGHTTNIDADECDGSLSGECAQDDMAVESGEFENEPQHNPDVVRGDEPAIEPLPEQGTTRNLLAKFQALQSTY